VVKKLLISLLLVSLSFSSDMSALPAFSAPQTSWLMQGRVYEGTVGDESTPLSGVTVSVYGANADWPSTGTVIDATTTDEAGWYGIEIFDDDILSYDYIYIEETDPPGYQSVGATTVDGIVRSAHRIDFEYPLEGKITSGNKFWDEIPVLSGRVYEGTVGDESTPLPGILMELYASNNIGIQGSLIYTTTTDESGWYGLSATLGYEFYTIVEVNPEGYNSEEATTVDGTVLDADRIRYDHPLAGQTLTGNKFWDVPVEGPLPDLVITEIWTEGGEICYQMVNIGAATAASGHETMLEIDGGWVETKLVPVDLPSEEPFIDCFAAAWSCSAPDDFVEVTADSGGAIEESNEDNNAQAVNWLCDVTPPEIIFGPIAVDITPTSAVIYWETTEPSSSDVFFGRFAESLPDENLNPDAASVHEVQLDGLLAYATYRFMVRSADDSGNAVESRVHSFRTLAEPDGEPPFVGFFDPGEITKTVTITATATDNSGVDRVQFLMDDVVIFTDYSPPYVLVLDSEAYPNGEHNLQTRAFDLSGNELTNGYTVGIGNLVDQSAPMVNITSPADGATVSGKINVNASLTDDAGLAQIFFKVVKGTNSWNEGFEGLPANPTFYNASFEWDTTQVANGSYRVAIEVYDIEGKYGYDVHDVTVDQSTAPKPAKLKVLSHTVARSGNGFIVTLKVQNVGDETASNVAIESTLKAFQPISYTTTSADYTVAYDAYYQEAEIQISANNSIPGGQTRTFTYNAAPVLFYPAGPLPSIGDYIYLHWDPPTGSRQHDIVSVPIITLPGGDTLFAAYTKAVKTADFILMTNPSRLFAFGYPDIDAVYGVLSEMAQLAIYEQGVLGYLNSYDRGKIDQLLTPTGAWGKMLSSQFSKALQGYVLIVGEREIVPTTLWGHFNLNWSNSKCTTTQVQDSDLSYANTTGDAAPELIVGRAIGNDPQDLYNVLHTSSVVYAGETGYSFDRSHALLVSGTDGNTSIQNSFTGFINDADKIITSDYAVTKIHWSSYTSSTVGLNAFTSATSGKDLVVYQGHGSPDGWGWFNTSWFDGSTNPAFNVAPVDFNGANPLVMGLACLTGSYEDHTANTCSFDGGDYNIAEGFLDKGAGVYIGSTEVSPVSINVSAGKEFFQTYWETHDTTIGKAFTELKRAHATSSNQYWRFWVYEYNLYGDPKYGALPAPMASTARERQQVTAPTPIIEVALPDYTITTLDNIDYVEIPGGSLLMEAELPQVPIYIMTVDYPAVFQVQNVALAARGGYTTTFGLHLPVHENWFASAGTAPASRPYANPDAVWYPDMDYDWSILDNPDGSSTLVLTIYPFTYNGTTTESRYYQNYEFHVDYTETNVMITEFTVDKDEVNYGDTLNATLAISATGMVGDASVGCVIKHAGTGEVMAELLMETLTGLKGQASFTPSWLADHVPQDNYFVTCVLRSGDGLLLDQQAVMFYLGTTSGVIHDFTATPTTFMPGNVVTTSLVFHNDGTVDLSGTLVVDVRDSTGTLVKTLSQMFSGLAPANTTVFDAEWHTPPDAAGTYYLTGYVLYNSKVTNPEILSATTPRVYLPAVVRE
jgi:hypothetical protein